MGRNGFKVPFLAKIALGSDISILGARVGGRDAAKVASFSLLLKPPALTSDADKLARCAVPRCSTAMLTSLSSLSIICAVPRSKRLMVQRKSPKQSQVSRFVQTASRGQFRVWRHQALHPAQLGINTIFTNLGVIGDKIRKSPHPKCPFYRGAVWISQEFSAHKQTYHLARGQKTCATSQKTYIIHDIPRKLTETNQTQ